MLTSTLKRCTVILCLVVTSGAACAQSLDTPLAGGDQCFASTIDRYIWARQGTTTGTAGAVQARYALARSLFVKNKEQGFNLLMNGPWDVSLIPTFEAQAEAVTDSLLSADTSGPLLTGIYQDSTNHIIALEGAENVLRSNQPLKLTGLINQVLQTFGSKKKSLGELLNPPEDDPAFASGIKDTATILAACAQISVLNSVSCAGASAALLKEISYHGNFILPKLWTELITTPKLRDGIRLAALNMIARMKSQRPGDLLHDLRSGFERAGYSPREANEATWKALALYGNSGPNVGYRLSIFDLGPETSGLVVGYSVIATAIPYLDFTQRFSGQHHYAYPDAVKDSCLTPKPYHFWLSAYLARWLVQQGYSPEVARMATFIAAKGYQVHRDVGNAGGGLDKILSKSVDHPTNQVVRVDLTLAAAGAVYGSLVDAQTPKPIFLETGLSHLNEVKASPAGMPESTLRSWIVSNQAQALLAWDKLFRPNEALKFFEASQR